MQLINFEAYEWGLEKLFDPADEFSRVSPDSLDALSVKCGSEAILVPTSPAEVI